MLAVRRHCRNAKPYVSFFLLWSMIFVFSLCIWPWTLSVKWVSVFFNNELVFDANFQETTIYFVNATSYTYRSAPLFIVYNLGCALLVLAMLLIALPLSFFRICLLDDGQSTLDSIVKLWSPFSGVVSLWGGFFAAGSQWLRFFQMNQDSTSRNFSAIDWHYESSITSALLILFISVIVVVAAMTLPFFHPDELLPQSAAVHHRGISESSVIQIRVTPPSQ